MKSKQFVFFISSLGSGGAERQLTFLSNYLVRQGHSVQINVLSGIGTEPFYDLDEKVDYRPLSLRLNGTNKLKRLFFLFKRVFVFSSIMRKSPREAIFLSFMDVMNLVCIVSALLARRQINVAERSDPFHQPSSKLTRRLIDFSYRFTHKIFVQSEQAKNYFVKLKAKTHVVYNAFDFEKIGDLAPSRKEKKVFDCISVARLSSEKGVPFLVDLFLKLERENPDLSMRLRVFGQGVLSGQISKRIQNSKVVEYFGPSKQIYEEMVKSDLLLLASDYEGFPNVVLEALALGVPVLSSPTAGACQIKKVYQSPSLTVVNKGKFEEFLKDPGKISAVVRSDQEKLKLDFGVEFVMSQWEAKLLS